MEYLLGKGNNEIFSILELTNALLDDYQNEVWLNFFRDPLFGNNSILKVLTELTHTIIKNSIGE